MTSPAHRTARLAKWVVVLLCVCAGAVEAQGVHVAITPAASRVEPGGFIDLALEITQAGDPFNGFDAVIGFDPAALTLVPTSPSSLQQGPLMTEACGALFHHFNLSAGVATISDLLLCGGVSVVGPGQIYHLRFQASTTPQATEVRFLSGLQFYNGGLYVNPAYSSNAVVSIGTATAANPQSRVPAFSLRVVPNPARGRTAFLVEAQGPGPQRISVVDVSGRLVRRFEDSFAMPGRRTVTWDGRDEAGHAVPAGVYLVSFEAAGRSVSNHVMLVR